MLLLMIVAPVRDDLALRTVPDEAVIMLEVHCVVNDKSCSPTKYVFKAGITLNRVCQKQKPNSAFKALFGPSPEFLVVYEALATAAATGAVAVCREAARASAWVWMAFKAV